MHTGHWTRVQVDQRSRDALVVVPTGSTEQHGYHLPTQTDTLLATVFAHQLADGMGEGQALVFPPVHLGYSPHHFPYAGTLSLQAATFLSVLGDIAESVTRYGFHRLLFVNGHGGNDELVAVAARLAVEKLQMTAGAVSYWTPRHSQLLEVRNTHGGNYPVPGHAGCFETSLMLRWYPDLVQRSAMPPEAGKLPHLGLKYWFQPGSFASFDGFTDDPRDASAELGAEYSEQIREGLLHVAQTMPA